MDKKRLLLSLMGVSLITIVMMGSLALGGSARSHAASSPPKPATPHELQPIPFKAFDVPVVQHNIYYGADGNAAYAYNATTGALLWRYQKSPSVGEVFFMTVSDGSVFLNLWGFGNTLDNVVVALNASTGTLRWTSSSFGSGISGASAYVANGILYFLRNTTYVKSLYALRMSDGKILWVSGANTVYSDGQGMFYTSTIDTVTEPDLSTCALNAITGSQAWCDDHVDMIGMAQGVIYAVQFDYSYNTTHAVVALRASDGVLLRSYKGAAEAAYYNNTLYLLTPSPSGNGLATLCALRTSDDSQLWCTNAQLSFSNGLLLPGITGGSSITVKNGLVYVHSDSATQAFEADDGSLLWSAPGASLLFTDHKVAYLLSSSELLAYNGGDGHTMWQSPTRLAWCNFPVQNAIYCASSDGHVLNAYNMANGKLLWTSGFKGTLSWIGVTNGIAYATTTLITSPPYGPGILGNYAFNATTGKVLWKFWGNIPPWP